MVPPSRIEAFAQEAYLCNAAVFTDSVMALDSALGWVRNPSHPERWANAVARCVGRDLEVEQVLRDFAATNINVSWHVWSGSPPADSRFRWKERCDAMYASTAAAVTASRCTHRIQPLDADSLPAYVTAQRLGWENPPHVETLLTEVARARLRDPRQLILICCDDLGSVVGAAAAYHYEEWSYLKGDFVLPSHRGQGIHQSLLHARAVALGQLGVEHQVALADEKTSSRLYQRAGFERTHGVEFCSARASEWISL